MPETTGSSGNAWVLFALISVVAWGLYGVAMHVGQVGMSDPENGRYKAFLWVGVAYFLVAVLAPAGLLLATGSDWSMPTKGWSWSLAAGILGAAGAFGVLLAFGAKGHPAVVMSIIFAGAPIVNAIAVFVMHPPAGGVASLRWPFFLGIVMAAVGGTLVTLYKPGPPLKSAAAPEAPADSGRSG